MGVYNNNKDGTRSTLANTIQVVDAPMEQFLSRGEFNAITPNDVGTQNKLVAENEVIKTFDTMPSASELITMSNNTVFETDGFWTQRDGNGGRYIISTSALRGGLEITDGTNTRYLCILDDYGNPANEINVCKYGIREYNGNLYTDTITKESTFATQNTYIITHIYLMKQLGTFKFPKGRFVFADPLDLRARNITFEGACVPVMSTVTADYIANTSDSSPATILCFPFLQNGETAITTRYNVSNLIVYGNFHTYDISFDRTKTITAPNEVVTETITDNIQCTGINSTSSAVIQNVIVAGFYKGIERTSPASGYFFNISFVRCHYGINLGGDNKAIGVYGWDVHTLIRVAGQALQSVEQARVDNCVHMVELMGCNSVTLHDFDGDYCTDSMVLVNGGAEGIIATAFHARCCTLKSYDGSGGADPIDVRDLANTSGYGIIRLANSRYLKNCHFSFNKTGGQNPFDGTSNYKTPETVLTMDNWAKFEDCTFELPITADSGDYILSLFQTNANCKARVDTSSGTYYIEGASVRVSNDKRYNVLDYGLKGDGTTDNTEALRTLIATIPKGSVIFFPVGTYVITEGIEINKDVTFLGENEEMQTAGTAPNRLHDPMSIIKYGGSTANVTMFTKASGYYDVNFVNLTLDGGNSYDVTDNWTGTFTELPFYNQLETTNLAGINGLDVSILTPGIVKNCMFWGFSGYGVKIAQHKYVERCGFYKCKKGIVTKFSDSLLHDLWFCKCGTAIYMLPKENDTFASVNVSDIWADQLIDHLVEADSSVTSAQIITNNIWVDSVGKSAFYLPEAIVSRSHIQGTFGRIGMDYAGIADADRTRALAQYTDFLACGRLIYSTLELNISTVTVNKGSNANGECFSRLITTYKANHHNEHNKIICNSFPVAKLYDSNTQPQYAYFADTEYNGTDGNVLIYTGSTYVNGFFTYTNSPVGRCVAPSKDFLVYDRLAKKLYRSTAADNNTAWVEVKIEGDIPHYSTMPSTADLFALPNNTVFETDGYWERIDGNGGKYLITTNYTSGALKLVNDGATRYLVALNAVGAYERYIINPCRYGIRAIKGVAFKDLTLANSFAEENSAVFTNLVLPEMRAIYKFPAGEYVFKNPINLKGRQTGLKGEGCPNPTNGFSASSTADYTNTGTTLIFPFLNDGDIAIDTALSSISNIAIFGSANSYDISIDRTKTISAPNEVVTETAVVQCTGIKVQSANVSNVFVACFYKGIDGVGSNNYFNNIFLYKCHTGIHLGGDNKAVGVYAWLTHTCAEIQGSLVSLIQLRVDSCVNAMRVIGGKACTFEDIDGDYCTGSLIEVGDGVTWADVVGCSFSNIHGRACTLNSYDMTQNPDGIDVRDIPQSDNSGYGAIHVNIRVNFSNNSFIFNSKFGEGNPFDSASNYRTPNIGLTFENKTGLSAMRENIFRYNASISNNEDLLKKIQVKNDSTNYTLRVDAFNGTYYIEGTTAQEDNPSTDINFATLLGGE